MLMKYEMPFRNVEGKPEAGLPSCVALVSRDPATRRMFMNLTDGGCIDMPLPDTARDFKKYLDEYGVVAVAIIDVASLAGGEDFARILRMNSCHVPLVAFAGGEYEEDEFYSRCYNDVIDASDGEEKIRTVIENFMPGR